MLDLSLDHVGVAVRNLDQGRAAYQRLGFNLTPRSLHSGSTSPAGPVEPWGSGNHCAMFEQGYLEVVGLTDAQRYSTVAALLQLYQGAHIVAVGCGDAQRAYQTLRERDPEIPPAHQLQRHAAYGEDGGQTRLAQFRNIYLDRTRYPEAQWLFIEHVTPEVLWQPHLLAHPNGAVEMADVYLATDALQDACVRYQRLFATVPASARHGGFCFRLGRGRVHLLDAEAVARWAPGAALPAPPCVAGFGIRVRALAPLRLLLERNGVELTGDAQEIIVAPGGTLGAIVRFFV